MKTLIDIATFPTVEELQSEIARLKAENACLKEQLLVSAILSRASELIERQGAYIKQLEGKLRPQQWLNKYEAADLLGIDETTLALYRKRQEWDDGSFPWINNIHYQRMPAARPSAAPKTNRSTSSYRYNRSLLSAWMSDRYDWAAHQRAIEFWLGQQLSNQRKRKAS